MSYASTTYSVSKRTGASMSLASPAMSSASPAMSRSCPSPYPHLAPSQGPSSHRLGDLHCFPPHPDYGLGSAYNPGAYPAHPYAAHDHFCLPTLPPPPLRLIAPPQPKSPSESQFQSGRDRRLSGVPSVVLPHKQARFKQLVSKLRTLYGGEYAIPNNQPPNLKYLWEKYAEIPGGEEWGAIQGAQAETIWRSYRDFIVPLVPGLSSSSTIKAVSSDRKAAWAQSRTSANMTSTRPGVTLAPSASTLATRAAGMISPRYAISKAPTTRLSTAPDVAIAIRPQRPSGTFPPPPSSDRAARGSLSSLSSPSRRPSLVSTPSSPPPQPAAWTAPLSLLTAFASPALDSCAGTAETDTVPSLGLDLLGDVAKLVGTSMPNPAPTPVDPVPREDPHIGGGLSEGRRGLDRSRELESRLEGQTSCFISPSVELADLIRLFRKAPHPSRGLEPPALVRQWTRAHTRASLKIDDLDGSDGDRIEENEAESTKDEKKVRYRDRPLNWSDLHHLCSKPADSSGRRLRPRLLTATAISLLLRAYSTARPPASMSLPCIPNLLFADGNYWFDTVYSHAEKFSAHPGPDTLSRLRFAISDIWSMDQLARSYLPIPPSSPSKRSFTGYRVIIPIPRRSTWALVACDIGASPSADLNAREKSQKKTVKVSLWDPEPRPGCAERSSWLALRVELVARHLRVLPSAPADAPIPFPSPLVSSTVPSARPDLQLPISQPLPASGERSPASRGAEADWEAVKKELEDWKVDMVYLDCPSDLEAAETKVDGPERSCRLALTTMMMLELFSLGWPWDGPLDAQSGTWGALDSLRQAAESFIQNGLRWSRDKMMSRLTCLLGESGMLAGSESATYSSDLDIDTLSPSDN